ncbi:accessory gene regulator B family protein [Clostridium sp. SHJSY1]|uniref:accessory gene regulator B family protein n=1 Tax=Clostridium sp. SHJSY1 TaxID=2942483 RepID=UPI00287482FC|nr:accessory gene regulator B family protein [Clostridium sp. SHJSY1]MDS0526340.1 accessory gene regulator B family protein [Clostridium sp. SHJSY1]
MVITDNLSKKITNFIGETLSSSTDDLEKIEYGIKVIFANLFKMLILFFIAYMLGILKYTTVALTIFAILRIFACGVHASSSIQCIIIIHALFLGNVYASMYITLSKLSFSLIFLISVILTYSYAPADTSERPLVSKKLRNSLKFKSIMTIVISFIICIFIKDSIYINIITFGILEESLSITPISYKILGKTYNNYENIQL